MFGKPQDEEAGACIAYDQLDCMGAVESKIAVEERS